MLPIIIREGIAGCVARPVRTLIFEMEPVAQTVPEQV
jgi:hypothetical protein